MLNGTVMNLHNMALVRSQHVHIRQSYVYYVYEEAVAESS